MKDKREDAPEVEYFERLARQHREEPPPGSLLTLPFSSFHLPGPNMRVSTRNRSQDHRIYIFTITYIHTYAYTFT